MKIYTRGLFLCAKGHHPCVLLGALLIRYVADPFSFVSLSFIYRKVEKFTCNNLYIHYNKVLCLAG